MGLRFPVVPRTALFLFSLVGSLGAAPKLRLAYTTVGPYSIATGADGEQQIVDAYNAGDGSLSLRATPSVSWLTASVGAARSCRAASSCLPVQIGFQTAALAQGTYTGEVSVNDPNAVDAPQTITVTVQIGGGIPDWVDLYAAPNGSSARATLTSNLFVSYRAATERGGNWLAIAASGQGSYRFGYTYVLTAAHQEGMAESEYRGSVVFSDSSFAPDNKTVQVVFHVTSRPIADASALKFRAIQNSAKQTQKLNVNNRGLGSLAVSGVTASTSSGGGWLAAGAPGTATDVSADPSGLAPGVYLGTLSVATNAANGTLTVPVELRVVAQSPPLIAYRGAVNIGSWNADDAVAPGDIVAIYGEQFSDGRHAAPRIPLDTKLGPTRALVNGQPAPLYFADTGQVNIQIPFETPVGDATIRIERDGQTGNAAGVRVAERAPHILTFISLDYGVIQDYNQGNAFPMAAFPGVPTCRAHVGDVLIVWVTGLGQGSPAVATGAAAPADPLSWIPATVQVRFGERFMPPWATAAPQAVVMTPTLAGLYQVNVAVPPDAPKGDRVPLYLDLGSSFSNQVYIAVE